MTIRWAILVPVLATAGLACKKDPQPTSDPGANADASGASESPPPGPGETPGGGEEGGLEPGIPAAGRVAPLKTEATREQVQQAIQRLTKWVDAGARDPTNPWAMAHGLLVFGPAMKTTGDKSAVEVIIGQYVSPLEIGGRELHAFPTQTPNGVPVDPHGNMIVKTMLEVGVPKERKFELTSGGTITLEDLAKDAELMVTLPRNAAEWHRFAWTHGALLERHSARDALETTIGQRNMLELALRSISQLEADQRTLQNLLEQKAPERLQKDKKAIYAHPCGGLHFVQSTVRAALQQNTESLLAKARAQLDVVLFRWEGERRLYERIRVAEPRASTLIRVQELKFYGHILETFGLAKKWGVELTDHDKKRLRQVAGDLIRTANDLAPAYQALDKVKDSSAQTYYDLIGDGCHAVRGLRLGIGTWLE